MTQTQNVLDFAEDTLHQGLTYAQYDGLPGIRSGYLKKMLRSPAHLQVSLHEREEPSEALEFGSLFHTALENPTYFLENYVVEPEFVGKTKDGRDSTRSAEAKDKKAEWYDKQPKSKIIVKRAWSDQLIGMLDSARSHRFVSNLLKNGVRETSLVTTCSETGEKIKCRLDFLAAAEVGGYVIDIKTTRNAQRWFFMNQIFSYRYDSPFYILQAAHYAYCGKMSRAFNGESFTFVAIEKEPPYGINIYPMDVGCLAVGDQWRAELTRKYAECKAAGKWPCYPEQAQVVFPPQYVELPGAEGGDHP